MRCIRFMRLTPCWGGWLAKFELTMGKKDASEAVTACSEVKIKANPECFPWHHLRNAHLATMIRITCPIHHRNIGAPCYGADNRVLQAC